MEIKRIFANLIKENKKTIELRKPKHLNSIIHNQKSNGYYREDFKWCDNGRFYERMTVIDYVDDSNIEPEEHTRELCFAYDCYCYHNEDFSITINGYQIINKKELIMYKNLTISNGNKRKYLIPNWFTKNWNWIYENWLWLINDYFKNESEILVLHIESFK